MSQGICKGSKSLLRGKSKQFLLRQAWQMVNVVGEIKGERFTLGLMRAQSVPLLRLRPLPLF